MKEILIVAALIIAVALLFWLDRKGKNEELEAGRVYDAIFGVFGRTKWGMNPSELRKTFPEKELVSGEGAGGLKRMGYAERVEGHDALINFHFSPKDVEKLVRVEFQVNDLPARKSDLLFGKLSKEHGFPLSQSDAENKSVSWDLGDGILILEVSDNGELQVYFSDKKFYAETQEQT